jgi:hypothetical protein
LLSLERCVATVTAVAITARAWCRDVTTAIEVLGEQRRLRLAVLLAVNAVSLPYSNLAHDAQLYALQVLNRVSNGAFSADLFLKFGSQDLYTPFSRVAAPLARLVGIEWSFFVFFLVSNTLLVVAIERLVATLIDDRVLCTLALLFVVMSPLPYAGLGVFQVRESFFTPRIAASALALFALTATLRQRYGFALALAAIATLAHPLMGFGAVLVVLICAGADLLPRRVGVAGLSLVVALGLGCVAYRPLGDSMFGTMDQEWLLIVRYASAYVVLDGWTVSDWVRMLAGFTLVSSAAFVMRHECPRRASLLFAVAFTAAVGIAATVVAKTFAYRVLVQAQPYRAVWLVHALQISAGAFLARRAWRSGGWGCIVAVLLLGVLATADFVVYELFLPLTMLAAVLFLHRRLRFPLRPESMATCVAASLIAGFVIWGLVKVGFVIHRAHDLLNIGDATRYARAVLGCVPRVVWFGVLLLVLSSLARQRHTYRNATLLAVSIAVVTHMAMFGLDRSPGFRAFSEPHGADVAFVRHFLEGRYASAAPPPTVYASVWENLGLVWLDLRARNYFAAVVVIFNRETAVETRRRAGIVRPFELERYRGMHDLLPEVMRPLIGYLFAPERPALPPTVSDLLRLCRPEEGVDVAVLSQHFGPLASADNGRVFIYECERVRAVTS